jgi:hypothetical protein
MVDDVGIGIDMSMDGCVAHGCISASWLIDDTAVIP